MSSEPLNRVEPMPDIEHEGEVRIDRDADIDEIIAESLERLVGCGPLDDPGRLRDLLPEADPDICQFVLVELIKLDLAMAAESGQLHRIERYVDALPDLLPLQSLPLDLVMEEIQLRKESGESPSHSEYLKRFPQFAAMFRHLTSTAEVTSAVGTRGAPPEQRIGDQLDDFLIIQKLGQGAFAHVYLATQISMHRLVALKVSRGKGDEPQALAQFDHPNIVRVFDQREMEDPQLHLLYMQFHPGGTLEDVVKSVRVNRDDSPGDGFLHQVLLDTVDRNLLRNAQAVPDRSSVRDWISSAEWPTVVAWIGLQLARALDDAHGRDVLHRDVKPANVLLSAEGIPKLADFNVSFAGAAGRAGAAASFGGSIGYMAPEHLRAISANFMDEPVEVQEPADLFSLAVLLWELWQGHRPFTCGGAVNSWSDAVAQQLTAREQPLSEPQRMGTASERVLEKTLRSALSPSPADRPASGAEMAAGLRLALHPEAASLFDPGESSLRSRLTRLSPWLVAGTAILVPHIAAGVFNYLYNQQEILDKRMLEGLDKIAFCVNLVAYPLAVPVMAWFAWGMVRGVRSANEGTRVLPEDVNDTVNLGHRAALIGGTFWMIAGIIYPLALWWMYPEFPTTQAVHFFVSLLVCGGVAMIYPFFGLALICTLVYYPLLVRGSMQDDHFDTRAQQMIRRSEAYLLMAAITPLIGAALIISSESQSRGFMLTAIAAGVIGLLAAFFAFRLVSGRWARMGEVLSSHSSVVPGESEGNSTSGY
jgi:serine/threonine protein kinase